MSGSSLRALGNASELIEVLADSGSMTVAEAAERVSLPRATVYRIVEALVASGMVDPLPNAQFALSTRWLRLADAARSQMTEWARMGEVLESLVAQTGQTAFLSIPYRGQMLCLDWRQGRGIDMLNYRPGSLLPMNSGAAGRVLAAYADAASDSDLASVRERGYAVSEEDVTPGIGAVGVPVFSPDGSVRAALSVGGLITDIHAGVAEFAESLRAAASRLEAL